MATEKIDYELLGIWHSEWQEKLGVKRAAVGIAAGNCALAIEDLSAAVVMALGDQPFDEDGVFVEPLAASYDAAQAASEELELITRPQA